MFCDPLLGKKQIDAPHRLWLMRSRPFKTVGISMTSTAAPLGMTPRSWLDLGVLSFLWGLSFLFYDIALDGLSPLAVVFGRCGVAALFLLIMFLMMRRSGDPFGSGGMMGGFIRSPARRFEKSDEPVTYDDVAGLKFAKQDLEEIVDFLKSDSSRAICQPKAEQGA